MPIDKAKLKIEPKDERVAFNEAVGQSMTPWDVFGGHGHSLSTNNGAVPGGLFSKIL